MQGFTFITLKRTPRTMSLSADSLLFISLVLIMDFTFMVLGASFSHSSSLSNQSRASGGASSVCFLPSLSPLSPITLQVRSFSSSFGSSLSPSLSERAFVGVLLHFLCDRHRRLVRHLGVNTRLRFHVKRFSSVCGTHVLFSARLEPPRVRWKDVQVCRAGSDKGNRCARKNQD